MQDCPPGRKPLLPESKIATRRRKPSVLGTFCQTSGERLAWRPTVKVPKLTRIGDYPERVTPVPPRGVGG